VSTIEYNATGRRKTAVARVRMSAGDGTCTVNKRDFTEYFPLEALRNYILQPLELTNTAQSFNISARLTGGGMSGQAGALRHAISRALTTADEAHKDVLKASGCLTRDPRMKERKKPGQPGARKRFQFSKR
jgi:small subunit ribosomal protein S9